MMIRQDFECSLPPKAYLMQVMGKTASEYCYLWDRKDKENCLSLTWSEIRRLYNKNTFRTNLRELCSKGLLDYNESDDGVEIELVGWDNEE